MGPNKESAPAPSATKGRLKFSLAKLKASS